MLMLAQRLAGWQEKYPDVGSTSQALVRHARCPVLVVRPEAAADAERE